MADQIRAEMVANVLQILVSAGDQVESGDSMLILESMKMEIPVLAERAGTVLSLGVAVGDVVQEGDVLVELD